jgi:tRNA 2-selenouridine synthase
MTGNMEPVVEDLLSQHYDPVYLQSMRRNFLQYPQAQVITPTDRSVEAMRRLAKQVLQDPAYVDAATPSV